MAALKASLKPIATVKRDGKFQQIDAGLLVPGDCVLLGAGSAVPADCLVSTLCRIMNAATATIQHNVGVSQLVLVQC